MKKTFDTDLMNLEDMEELMKEIRRERDRKLKYEKLVCRMTELLQDARDEGYHFTSTSFVLSEDSVTLFESTKRFE